MKLSIVIPCYNETRTIAGRWATCTVYGSLTTSIAVLLSLEVAATLLLLGAQVISEYERLATQALQAPAEPFTTDPV